MPFQRLQHVQRHGEFFFDRSERMILAFKREGDSLVCTLSDSSGATCNPLAGPYTDELVFSGQLFVFCNASAET
jgi:hypothetical protein